MNAGEQYAWATLRALASEDVCARTGATFDGDTGSYGLDLFNQHVNVSLGSSMMSSPTQEGTHLVTALSYFSVLSVLSFLINGKPVPPSGRLVKPGQISGLDAMVRGSHTLPLPKLSARYAADLEGFLKRGQTYGGIPQAYGDASILLHPFKVVPVVLILWAGDDEFPARSDLLLDETCPSQLPADILWCIMMLTVLEMLT